MSDGRCEVCTFTPEPQEPIVCGTCHDQVEAELRSSAEAAEASLAAERERHRLDIASWERDAAARDAAEAREAALRGALAELVRNAPDYGNANRSQFWLHAMLCDASLTAEDGMQRGPCDCGATEWEDALAAARAALSAAPATERQATKGDAGRASGIAAAFARFKAETERVPVGAEDRAKGQSVYNWRTFAVREIERLAAGPAEDAPRDCTYCNGEGIITRAFAEPHDIPCPKCQPRAADDAGGARGTDSEG